MTPNVLHKLQGAQLAASVSSVVDFSAGRGAEVEPYAGGEREAEVNEVIIRARAERRAALAIRPAKKRAA